MDAQFNIDLVQILGSSKCTPSVVRALYCLSSGQSSYLDGVTLEMLKAVLPDAVSNSVHRSLGHCKKREIEKSIF